jgi:hypothetical protein
VNSTEIASFAFNYPLGLLDGAGTVNSYLWTVMTAFPNTRFTVAAPMTDRQIQPAIREHTLPPAL